MENVRYPDKFFWYRKLFGSAQAKNEWMQKLFGLYSYKWANQVSRWRMEHTKRKAKGMEKGDGSDVSQTFFYTFMNDRLWEDVVPEWDKTLTGLDVDLSLFFD